MRAISGLWRWRDSPLRRPTDRAEVWVCLVALVLIGAAAPAIGWLTGAAADGGKVVVQREHARRTDAVAEPLLGGGVRPCVRRSSPGGRSGVRVAGGEPGAGSGRSQG
ncbi:hypothetical protein [Streptomyces sp. NPDC048242]|uniref:hypothetical protein n=1 Tax=Streptomyces sp. NPDC048242 TaxID=3155026 RepID=UPI0034166097